MARQQAQQNQRDRQQRQWQGPDVSIVSFETPESGIKVGENFTLVAVTAFRRSGPPRQTQHVVFEDNGVEIGEELTDAEGRAVLDHSFSTPGSHRLTAHIRDLPVSRVRKSVNVREPDDPDVARLNKRVALISARKTFIEKRRELAAVVKPPAEVTKLKEIEGKTAVARAENALRELTPTSPVPTTFEVFARPQGPAKEYALTAAVGAKGVTVEIFDPANPRADERRVIKETGNDGTVRHQIKTTGPRELTLHVPMAPELPTIELRLAGPDKVSKPVEFREIPTRILKGSWKELFRWVDRDADRMNRET